MDTELLEAEELDVDQTRSARHERPVFLRSPPLPHPQAAGRRSQVRPSAPVSQPADRRARYGHAGAPVEERPMSGCR